MNSATLQHERHMAEVTRSQRAARDRNYSGRIVHAQENAKLDDRLAEQVEESLFGEMSSTDTQDVLHEFGGGLSSGPPAGGWPVFDTVTGKRLVSPQTLSASPH